MGEKKKKGVRGREVEKEGLLVGGSCLVFLLGSLSCGCTSCDDM